MRSQPGPQPAWRPLFGTKSLSEKGSDPLQRGQKTNEIDLPPKGQTPFRRGVTVAGLVVLLSFQGRCVPSRVYGQEDPEDLTIQAMCRIGLTDSAVQYVTARRALVGGDSSGVAKWTMRLMESHAFAALHSRDAAELSWKRCQEVMEEFVASEPENPRLPWLAWQQARCKLLRGQSELAHYLAAPANAAPREAALEIVRSILTDLAALEEDIRQRQPLAARQAPSSGEQAPTEQLHQLSVDVGLMRCESLLIRSRLYSPGSPDRIAAATDIDRQATDVLQRTEKDWPSREQLLVARATARLDLGSESEALLELEQLAREAQNRQARIRAAAGAISALVASSSLSRASALLEVLASAGAGPEVELAAIELKLAEVRAKSGEAQEATLLDIMRQAQQLGVRYGDYWQSRGEALLIGAATASLAAGDHGHRPATVSLELLNAQVRQLLAAGNEDAAIERLLQFSQNESAANRAEPALRVATQAAALYQRKQDWQAASEVLATISQQHETALGAAEAHLQAVFCASQALREAVENSDLRQQYERLMKQQLALWPDAVASNEPQAWLHNWLSAQGRHNELADIYLSRAQVSKDTTFASEALENWLGVTLALDEPASRERQISQLTQAVADGTLKLVQSTASLVQLFVHSVSYWPTTAERSERVRALGRLELSGLAQSHYHQWALAVRLLEALRESRDLSASRSALDDWEPHLLSLPVQVGLTKAFVDALDETPIGNQRALAKQLRMDREWAELLLAETSVSSQASGYRMIAWLEDPMAALSALSGLVEKAGRGGGGVQLQLSNALAASGPNRLEESSRVARLLIASSAAGSELQLAARWRLIKNQILVGQREEARRSAQLLLATQVTLSDLWKDRLGGVGQ